MKVSSETIDPNRTAQMGLCGELHAQVNRLFLIERFLKRPQLNAVRAMPSGDSYATAGAQAAIDANDAFELAGTNAAASGCVHSTGGGVKLTTATSDGDQAILQPHADTNVSLWNTADWSTDDQVRFGAIIATDSSIADMAFIMGLKLTNTLVTATDADQTFFRYEDSVNGGRLQAIDSNDGTDNAQDTQVTVAASTLYNLVIDIDQDRVPRYYVNGDLVVTGNALATAHDLIPYIGVETDTSGAKVLYCRCLWASKEYNN